MGKSWKNPLKVANAAKKGALFSKLVREIQVAAKLGGIDLETNARLRMAVDAAKEQSCPNDTIDRAIKKGAGLLDDGSTIEEMTYEGFGPHGVGVIVEIQSDNKNRTAPEMRNLFKTYGGHLGETGSVAWMFTRVGLVEGKKSGTFDPEEEAIEAGADSVEKHEDGSYAFFCALDQLSHVTQSLKGRSWIVSKSEPSFKANNFTEITPEQRNDVQEFLGELEEHDDTHRIHATLG